MQPLRSDYRKRGGGNAINHVADAIEKTPSPAFSTTLNWGKTGSGDKR